VDPGAATFRTAFAERLVADDLDGQLAGGATILMTAGHVHEAEVGFGRQNDLLLARLAAEEFLDRRAFAPAPGRDGRRELYATLLVQGRHASDPSIVDWLARAYADLENLDGYWIVAVNTHRSGKQLAGYLRLALQLEAMSERPTVTSCVGDPHLALLASGVAATCAGLHGMSFKFPPDELALDEGDDEAGFGVHTYHPGVLGNAGPLGPAGDAIRAALFKNRPCACGHHDPVRAPAGRREIVAHNCFVVQSDAWEFGTAHVEITESRLHLRVAEARRNRQFYGMPRLHPGFVTVGAAAARLRQVESGIGES